MYVLRRKILLNNENEYIYRHIDEAEIKQAEIDQTIMLTMLRKMELLEKNVKKRER